jgi:ribosomal protein S12 methylthiotransferase accessory factor
VAGEQQHGRHLRETLLALPGSEWEKEDYLNLIEQLDDEGHDDFTRVRELLGLATGKDNGWYTLRIGELKAMLALAGGDLDQALIWTEWTMEFNQSVFSRAHQLLPLPANPAAAEPGRRASAAAISERFRAYVRR